MREDIKQSSRLYRFSDKIIHAGVPVFCIGVRAQAVSSKNTHARRSSLLLGQEDTWSPAVSGDKLCLKLAMGSCRSYRFAEGVPRCIRALLEVVAGAFTGFTEFGKMFLGGCLHGA